MYIASLPDTPQIKSEEDINNFKLFNQTVDEYIEQVKQERKRKEKEMKLQLDQSIEERKSTLRTSKKKQTKQLQVV